MAEHMNTDSRLEAFLDRPYKSLWTLAIPIMVGMSIQNLYSVVDIFFIGRLGGDAIAAVAFNMPLFFLMMGLSFGLGAGVTSAIARYIGANDKVRADNTAEHAVMMALVISVTLMSLGLVYGPDLLRILGAPTHILPQSWSYLKVMCLGAPFMIFAMFFRSILAGEGDMKLPMLVAGLGTVMNIILDPIFIFGLGPIPRMEVQGAAIATALSMMLVFIVYVYLLFIKEHAYVRFRMKDFSPSLVILKEIIRVGLPASMSMFIMSIGQLVFNKILVNYSSDVVAAYQVGNRIEMFMFLPIFGIATALTTMVGMFYGASEFQKLKEIIRYGVSRSFLLTSMLSAVLYLMTPSLVSIFSDEQFILNIATVFLRYMCFIFPLVSIGICTGRIMQGFGKGLPMLVITTVRVLIVAAPLAIFFSTVLDKPVHWNWFAIMISTSVSCTISVVWLWHLFNRQVKPNLVMEAI